MTVEQVQLEKKRLASERINFLRKECSERGNHAWATTETGLNPQQYCTLCFYVPGLEPEFPPLDEAP